MNPQENKSHLRIEKIGLFDVFVFLLSIYAVGELAFESLFDIDGELLKLLQRIDLAVCGLFLVDFGVRFQRAPSKREFMKWGWIDLISSLPLPAWGNSVFAGRILRVFRMLRLIRAYRSFHSFVSHLFHDVPHGTLTSIPIITFFVVLFGSISVLAFEKAYPGSNIRTAEDAIWWTMTTITTVGYGDHYPVSTEGRIVAVLLMVTGGGLFGTFTAVVSTIFLRASKKDDPDARAERMERQLHEIHRALREIQERDRRRDSDAEPASPL
ncbi:MAG TPA: ion transporter [Candidatus Methylacidiphilales bacterium]